MITPDLRRLRMALGLQVQSAAALLGEPASLLENQESARSADPVFVASVLSKYLDYGSALSREGTMPLMATVRRTTAVYELRLSLGLRPDRAALILGISVSELDAIESAGAETPKSRRDRAWSTYIDWAIRRRRRLDRRARVQRRVVRRGNSSERNMLVDPTAELREMHKLAYAPRLSPAQAEAEVWKYLDSGTV
ncbi:hypothetical protein ACFFGH_10835 [Lysobacter korlensis]|uniref:DNA-binding protein n=1 Tax=Lysobacter korlensis TaxID=553636 RepID=A0ABV6RMW9_9GAMM